MEFSFGKNFTIVAKLALSGSSATSRPYKKGGGGGGSFSVTFPPDPLSHHCREPPAAEPTIARAQVPCLKPPLFVPCVSAQSPGCAQPFLSQYTASGHQPPRACSCPGLALPCPALTRALRRARVPHALSQQCRRPHCSPLPEPPLLVPPSDSFA